MSIQIKPDMADRIQVSNEAYRPEGPPRAKRNWRLIGGAAAVVVLAGAAIAVASGWLSGGPERMARSPAEIPLIKAEEGPLKVRPEDPGGMEVPNRDMLVYRRFEGASERPPVERLLPNAEQPVVPPRPKAAPGREAEALDEEGANVEVMPEVEDLPERDVTAPPAETIEELLVRAAPEQPPTAPPEPVQVAKPEPASMAKKPAAPAPSPVAAPAPGGGAYQVQLVAVRSREQAQASWGQLSKKHADVLGGLRPDIVRADLGTKGVIYRLRAGPAGDEGKARALCASLAKRKVDCLVVPPSG